MLLGSHKVTQLFYLQELKYSFLLYRELFPLELRSPCCLDIQIFPCYMLKAFKDDTSCLLLL